MFKKIYIYLVRTSEGYEFDVSVMANSVTKADGVLNEHIKQLGAAVAKISLREEICTTNTNSVDRILVSELTFHKVAKCI